MLLKNRKTDERYCLTLESISDLSQSQKRVNMGQQNLIDWMNEYSAAVKTKLLVFQNKSQTTSQRNAPSV